MRGKEYITSRAAAEALGVAQSVVDADVQAGEGGALASLLGQRFADYTLIYSWQLAEPYLSLHRIRLADAGTVARGEG